MRLTAREIGMTRPRPWRKTMLAVHAKVLKAPDAARPHDARLTLVRKPPGNAELPS
jgi:hypothetical protein